jgi:hypothetical protein
MRYLNTLPAWAARQRSRRLVRHSDEKVVRWISHNTVAKDDAPESNTRGGSSSNDNVLAFVPARSVQAS